MNIALVASSRTSGGKLYAEKLSSALGATIISSELPILKIRSEIVKNRIDIVDLQMEYRTFGSHLQTVAKLPILALLLRSVAATYVTVHGVLSYEALEGQRFRWPKWVAFILSVRLTAFFSQKMIVHTEEMRRELIRLGIRNVVVVPHGSGPFDYHSQDSSRTKVLFFGFLRPSKGVDTLILSFRQVIRRYPSAFLTIAGCVTNDFDSSYYHHLLTIVEEQGLTNNVAFWTEFIPEIEKKSLAVQSAILILPYTDRYLEVSGVVHDFSGYGLALICSKTPRFGELVEGVDCLKVQVTASQLGDNICKLLGNPDLRERLAKNLSRLASDESWKTVASMRLAVYSHH